MAKSQHAHRYRLLPGLLREMRESAGLTQRQLAVKLRDPHVFVHKSEVGARRVDVAEFMDWCIACSAEPEAALKLLRHAAGCKSGCGLCRWARGHFRLVGIVGRRLGLPPQLVVALAQGRDADQDEQFDLAVEAL
jgi:hypothetical protein